MKKVGIGLKILIGVIISLLLGLWIGLTYNKNPIPSTSTQIPPSPDPGQPMFYDFDSETWVYVFQQPRANGNKKRGVTEKELQRYLEKKIPNYLEDTYWGEEYDLENDKD